MKWAALLLWTLAAIAAPRQGPVRAAYLYQILNYVEWPSQAGADDQPMVINVIGDSEILSELKSLARRKEVKGRRIAVRASGLDSNLSESDVVLVESSSPEVLKKVLDQVRGLPVLVVTYAPGFARLGSVINFTLKDDRMHFEINRKAAESQKLGISPQLLKLSKIVG